MANTRAPYWVRFETRLEWCLIYFVAVENTGVIFVLFLPLGLVQAINNLTFNFLFVTIFAFYMIKV